MSVSDLMKEYNTELTLPIIEQEIDHSKLVLGWLMINFDDCFERDFLIDFFS